MDEPDATGKDVRAAYRGLPQAEPPARIDAAVLAAARAQVAPKRSGRWHVPVSLAAVLVLSVTVTLRVAEEEPATEKGAATSQAEAPARAPAPAPAGVPEPAAPPVAEPQPPPKVVTPRAKTENRARPPEKILREEAAPAPSVAAPQADAAPPRTMAAAPAPFAEAASGAIAQQGARADRRAPMAAKQSAEANALEAPMAPEAWIDKILGLRAKGLDREADESYAAFRRAYPGYAVLPETLQKIAPSRP